MASAAAAGALVKPAMRRRAAAAVRLVLLIGVSLGIFELRSTEHEALPADIDMFRTMSRGVHGTAMPPWFALPERDRWALVGASLGE